MLDRKTVHVGIAPIGWTNDDMPELGGEIPFEQCVSEMALAGYTGCELGGKFPKDTAILKRALDLRGLAVCNAWFSAYLTTAPLEETVDSFRVQCEFLKALGAGIIGMSEQGGSIQGKDDVPVYDAKPVFDDDEWDRVVRGIHELAGHASDFGLRLTYHHHMGTGVQTAAETRRLLESTDEADLSLLFDTGHFAMSGEDPASVLEEFLPRVRHVHLKDVRTSVAEKVREERISFLGAVRAGVFTVPGDGTIDFDPVFSLLDQGGYQGWMVVEAEQDPAIANPLEYAIRGRRYVREHAGV